MAVFLITSPESNVPLQQHVTSLYHDHFVLSDKSWLVVADGSAAAIAQSLGVTVPDAQGVGSSFFGHMLVVQITANYWGFGTSIQWEWLKSAFQRTPS